MYVSDGDWQMRTVKEWTVDAVSALLLTLSLIILLSLLTYRVDAKTFAPVQEHAVVLMPGAVADGSIRGAAYLARAQPQH